MDGFFWIAILCLVAKFADAGFRGYSTDIECYQRVAVGKRLNSTEVSSSQGLATVRQCEQECERASCHAFAFGVSTGGNGTCELANETPKGEPVSDIDYDLFYKNSQCLNRTSCFKRMAVGRSLMDRFVKRELYCDSLRACEEACALESAFVCEGFNFKFDKVGFESKCQLTNIPSEKLSLTSDFNANADFDFFERDRNAPRRCHFPNHVFHPPWGSGDGWSPGGPPGGGPEYAIGHGYNPGRPQDFHHPNRIPDGRPPPGDFFGDRGPPNPPPQRPPMDYNPNQIAPPRYPPERFGDKGYDYGGGPHAWLGNGFGLPEECFVRIRSGFRLDRAVCLASISVPTLYDCEYECANSRKFVCNSFSFRYSSVPGGDNCQLSDRFYRTMDTYTDILPDRDYDIYDRNPNGRQDCQPKRFWGSDCFERVKSGLKLKDAMTKFSIKVSSLSECEAACINMPYFTCRAFSYRYGPPVIGDRDDNCLLTDLTLSNNLNINKDFAIDPDCELYYRGSYGHGCEIGRYPEYPPIGGFERPLPPPPPPDNFRPGGYLPPDRPGDRDNFIPNNPNAYLPPDRNNIIPPKPGPAYLPGKGDLPPRPGGNAYLPPPPRPPGGNGFPVKPGGGAYLPPSSRPVPPDNSGDPGYLPPERPPNAYLPVDKPGNAYLPAPVDKPDRGYLPPRGKYPYGERKYGFFRPYQPGGKPDGNRYLPPDGPVYGIKGYRPRPSVEMCYIRSSTPARLLPGAVKVAMWCPSEQECKDECTRAREKTRFRCSTISYRDGQCELSDIEQRDLRMGYDYLQDKEFWMFTWDFGTPSCYYPPYPGKPPMLNDMSAYADRGVAETWAHFTVNGQPCRAGTVCTMNPEVGVWSCPVDNGDWDYCCRSGHHCGYSEGYDYPWCYVGSADRDQWRPCSDSYYPYAHSGRKLHWPVAYLHREGPPNITLEHKPSIVDRFLSSLDKIAGKTPSSSNGTTLEMVTIPAEPRKEGDSSAGDTGKQSAMDKLWMWGKSKYNNLTSTVDKDDTTSSATSSISSTTPTTSVTTITPPTTTTTES